MDEVYPWDWLNSRYENDEVARFTLVLDAVEEATHRTAKADAGELRLGLIVTDYVADLLLARRIERVIMLSERAGWGDSRQRFDSRARGELRQGFNRRVTLAARPYEARFIYGLGDPILDDSDAEVLRVAHAYRNDVYHEDKHNERTLPVVLTLALHAVVRAWMRSLPTNIASSAGVDGPLMSRLLERGYEDPQGFSGMRVLSLHAGAQAVSRWLTLQVPVDFPAHRRLLADDIRTRIFWAESMIEWLSGPQGPGRDQIEPALAWHDFWRQHGDNPELVSLDAERASTYERVWTDADRDLSESERQRIDAAEQAYAAKFSELLAAHRSSLRIADLRQLARRGAGLTQAANPGTLLARYRGLDMDVRLFEETLAEMAEGWEEHVQHEVDRLRGK
jgi:hypothetical protein